MAYLAERSLLRQRPLVALLAAETVSTTGSQMTWLALPWFVLVTSGSATRMSAVVGAELIGLAVLGIPGGAVLRRLGAWQTMLLSDAVRAPLMLAIPALHWAGVDAFAAILVLAFLLGALAGPFFAAQKVIVPELLGEDESLVGRANALFQGATRITMLLGPVLGGILIATVSAPWALVVDAGTYVVSAVLVLTLVPKPARLPPVDEDVGARRGLRFLAREPLLRLWIPLFALGDTAWTAFFVSVPVLVVVRFDADPRIAGWLLAAFGVGAVVGNVAAYRVLLERVRGLTLVGTCILGQALPLWLLTIHPSASLAAFALGLSGLANGIVNPPIHSMMTLRVPPPLRPSVMTVNVMIFGLAQPLGVFGVGPVLDAFGPQPVLVAFAAVQTVAMALIAASTFAARRATAHPPAVEAKA
ncbi:MAG: MFS transporter [Actinobacteria bacterium]|nr:MFS transporter [Actinomycetota bacterium]